MDRWAEKNIADMTGKRILITGGASGIGLETAKILAAKGAQIIIADRDEVAGHKAVSQINSANTLRLAEFYRVDLSCLSLVRRFATDIVEIGKPIDVLVNNAGIQPIGERRISADGFELTFAIGHLAHFTLTSLLLPLLKLAPEGRVVTVSSLVHGQGRLDWDDLQMEKGYRAQRAYNQTKLANLLFAREFQRRLDLSGSALKSIAVHPGVARTSIGANRKQLGKFGLGDYLVSGVLKVVMPYLGQSAEAGALPTIYGAASLQAKGGGFYGPGGFGEMKGLPSVAKIKPSGQNEEAAQKLWRVSEELTAASFDI